MHSLHSVWRNESDVMDDIWALSEMEGISSQEVAEPPPATILEYRAQMRANNTGSVYDTPAFGDENVTYIISGRGTGKVSTILRPGVSHLSDSLVVQDVQKKIREVSGLGYSNEFIEQGVKAMTMKNGPSSTQKKTPIKTSGLCSPMGLASTSSCSSLNSDSPVPTVDPGPPPPLSVMRQRAEEERANNKKKAAEVAPEEMPSSDSSGSRSGNEGARRNASPSSSSEEGSWRRRQNGNTVNRFFKQETNGFHLDCNEFPALK